MSPVFETERSTNFALLHKPPLNSRITLYYFALVVISIMDDFTGKYEKPSIKIKSTVTQFTRNPVNFPL